MNGSTKVEFPNSLFKQKFGCFEKNNIFNYLAFKVHAGANGEEEEHMELRSYLQKKVCSYELAIR